MDWLCAIVVSLFVWGLCGAVMMVGRRFFSMRTTIHIHLAAAPVFAFALSCLHAHVAPAFDPMVRAGLMTGMIVVLDAGLVAPVFERSFEMFRSILGTWVPFALIFAASWLAGTLMAI
ncbi:MAG: hypothetical protein KKB37_11125 [Alphaproteobacteria bacterium]|nr:hypothetical protein [Alphaproteobacteria bacterium]